MNAPISPNAAPTRCFVLARNRLAAIDRVNELLAVPAAIACLSRSLHGIDLAPLLALGYGASIACWDGVRANLTVRLTDSRERPLDCLWDPNLEEFYYIGMSRDDAMTAVHPA
jgi:hypothetical protein